MTAVTTLNQRIPSSQGRAHQLSSESRKGTNRLRIGLCFACEKCVEIDDFIVVGDRYEPLLGCSERAVALQRL